MNGPDGASGLGASGAAGVAETISRAPVDLDDGSRPGLQPLVHDLVVTLQAPTAVLSAPSGDLAADTPGGGAHGLFHADVRALSVARLLVGGEPPTPVLGTSSGPARARFVALARSLGDPTPDPSVRIDRHRHVVPGCLREEVVVSSTATSVVRAVVELELAADLAGIEEVKGGRRRLSMPPEPVPEGLAWAGPAARVVVSAPGAQVGSGSLRWDVELPPHSSATLRWQAEVTVAGSVVAPPPSGATWSRPSLHADDRRLTALLEQALDDLSGLRLSLPGGPGDVFLAAGAPWFFTLFGRDSLWAARMLLPLGTELAHGTLRVLAARQGRHADPRSQEEPGKILHELRRDEFDDGHGLHLPPVYFGTVDATPLWVCLLHDAWRWGLEPAAVEALLPAMEAALGWMAAAADAGGGFLAYADPTGHGLANQGWKDSGDAVRFADGSFASPPVALAEVQGYTYEAAVCGAALLEAFDRPGADGWRSWARDLAGRFRSAFWVRDEDGPFPAMALDGDRRPVDSVTSNMGHLLGTGILDAAETATVASRLAAAELADGYGLRTMSSRMAGYSPLSYHCGSVWPHDTAIAIMGLARTGHADQARPLVEGLLSAGVAFGGRLPELYGGDARGDVPAPVPYPAACRPQAWSAAAAVAVLGAVLGIAPDVPGGTVAVRPMAPSPVGALSVEGLRVAGGTLDVRVDADGTLASAEVGAGLRLSGS